MMKKVICFGEVLWDDFGETKTIGGAPLNVCYHLSKLNIHTIMVSQVGNDGLGEALLNQMQAWEIDSLYCPVTKDYATSTVKVNLQDEGDIRYVITENVAWDFLTYSENVAREISTADAFVYGTLAARSSASRKVLLDYVQRAKWPVLDLNLRHPYCEDDVIIALVNTCRSIKLNQEELNFICKLVSGRFESEQDSVNTVFSSFDNIFEIILTKGEEGAAYYNRKEHLTIKGVPVKVKDTVGSGDSFLAAFIHGKLSGKTNQQILIDAIILSAFMATQNGGCPSYTLQEIEHFKNSIL